MEQKATPILPTLRLFQFAKTNGVSVFIITGRLESERDATEQNLRKAGYSDWDRLFMKADGTSIQNVRDFKSPIRQQIREEGFNIVINLGDQQSDLDGEPAELTLKLPNPFYFIP